jgi:retron-type reverse transcriptase
MRTRFPQKPYPPVKLEVILCVRGVVSPLLSNIVLHEVDRQWCGGDGTMSNSVVLVRYADDMVLLARTELEAKQAWERLQSQFAALRLVVNQEKSRLTTVDVSAGERMHQNGR